ncbi:MAG: hypothetical protein CMD20_03820 [Flavobacteriales bacterium]|nr:hypothetical protein [Flavobacteriales bacterium]
MKKNKLYDLKVVSKPWGHEYVIYSDKKKLAVTFLKINPKKETSLHCHSSKKTGFIILHGIANVQIGIYKSNIFKYKPMSRLVFRSGLFHKLINRGDKPLYALEFETPYNKKDLIRMKDRFGRANRPYEGIDYLKDIDKNKLKFKKPKKNETNKYKFKNSKITLKYISSFKEIKIIDNKSSVAILDGKILDRTGKIVINTGEVIKEKTLKILMQNFVPYKQILVLKVSR